MYFKYRCKDTIFFLVFYAKNKKKIISANFSVELRTAVGLRANGG